jgi:hypothetical protein
MYMPLRMLAKPEAEDGRTQQRSHQPTGERDAAEKNAGNAIPRNASPLHCHPHLLLEFPQELLRVAWLFVDDGWFLAEQFSSGRRGRSWNPPRTARLERARRVVLANAC